MPRYIKESKNLHIPVRQNNGKSLKKNKTKLSITWIGQATCLIQIDGINILTDPIWAKKIGNLKRYSLPGIEIGNLPPIDLILISHAHFDHLDISSLKALTNKNTTIITEKSILPIIRKIPGKHIGGEYGDQMDFFGIKIFLIKINHFAPRKIVDIHRKATGFIIKGKEKTIFFPGDTRYCQELKETGMKFSPDISLMPIGDYMPEKYRRHAHISPKEVTQAVLDLNTKLCVPIHWGTFKLSDDDMHAPVNELRKHSRENGTRKLFRILKHGETYWEKANE